MLSRRRRAWNYETNVPRCENCAHYRKPGTFLRDSLPRTSPPQCKLGEFIVKPTAVCDRWTGADGATLK